jgi:hypothetical protein
VPEYLKGDTSLILIFGMLQNPGHLHILDVAFCLEEIYYSVKFNGALEMGRPSEDYL